MPIDHDYAADQIPLGANILAMISQVAQEQVDAEKELASAEEVVEQKKAALKVIKEDRLPKIMEEAGQTAVTTSNGYDVEIKEVIRANIPKPRLGEGIAYLESINQGILVKHELTVAIGKGADAAEKLTQINEFCLKLGLQPDIGLSVHAGSLSATVRDLLSDGVELDHEILGIFRQTGAEVKPMKIKKSRAKAR